MKKKNYLILLCSIIITMCIKRNLLTSGNTIVFLFVFISAGITLNSLINNLNKRQLIITSIISCIFTIIEIVCKSIDLDYTFNSIINKWILIDILGLYLIIFCLVTSIFNLLEKIKSDEIKKFYSNVIFNNKLMFVFVFLGIFLAWMPYFLKFYPGIVTSDSYWQIEQALGIEKLSNHHPILHTAIIAICLKLGQIFSSNINIGIAIYSIFQMTIMALLDTSVVMFLKKNKASKALIGITILYYMFFPINGIYGITMWKDVLFSGVIPIFIILNYKLLSETEEFFKHIKIIVLYVIFSLLVIFLRNNGLYIVILSMPALLFALRKQWKKTVMLFSSIIILYLLLNLIIFNAIKVIKGSVVEMLSVPSQQIARVEKHHRDELDNEIREEIKKFFLPDNIGDLYNPILADDVKWSINEPYFQQNKSDFAKLWLKLLVKYPKDYIESFISNSYGYYYPEANNNPIFTSVSDKHKIGIKSSPKIEGKAIDYIIKILQERDIPILSMIFSIGFCVWIILICFGYNLYKKEYKLILLYLPLFILWLTIIASPVYCEFRYAYPIFLALPIFLLINSKREMEND